MWNLQKQKTLTDGIRDKVLLVTGAALVCLIGGAAFWLADDYHVNPVWVFFSWNALGLIAVVGLGFRRHWKKPLFILFFVVWMAVHGTVIVVLMLWVPILYWMVLIGAEFFFGYLVTYRLFGVPPDNEQ